METRQKKRKRNSNNIVNVKISKDNKVNSKEILKLGRYELKSISKENKTLFFPHRLEIIRKLGEGAFSKVYLVLDYYTKKKMVLKSTVVVGSSTENALYLETQILNEMGREDGFPISFGYYEEDNIAYSLQEYVEGIDLYGYINLKIPMSERQMFFIFNSLVNIVDRLHKHGIIHHDIKCENIMINLLTNSITLIDFGLSEISTPENIEKTFSKSGSKEYIPPEKLTASRTKNKYYCGKKSDFYSLGVVLYTLLFRHFPFDKEEAEQRIFWKSDRPLSFNKKLKISKYCKDFLRLILSIFPEKRPNYLQMNQHEWFQQFIQK